MEKTDFSKVKQARYIKLGVGGGWEKLCLREGTLRFGYWEVPQSFSANSDKKVIAALYKNLERKAGAASNHARQVMDFYAAGPETLWITFADGFLWWAQARQAVEFIGNDPAKYPDGSRLKRTLNGWSRTTLSGKPLLISELSGKLTRSASYRQTICEIKGEAFKYLLHKLQDQDLPAVKETKATKARMVKAIESLIQLLTWQDFELFVDLLFTSSGWRRVSVLGGTQKTTDMELILPLTNERAFVQVKSETSQQALDHYIEEFGSMSADRIFYVYHSSAGKLKTSDADISLMGPDRLAESALRAGLVDWLMEKVG